MANPAKLATVRPGVLKIAGRAITPVNPSTMSHTRLASVEQAHPRQQRDQDSHGEQSRDRLDFARECHSQHEGQQSDHTNARIEGLQKAALAGSLLREHGAGQSVAKSDRGGLDEAAAHDAYSLPRFRSSSRRINSDRISSNPTPNMADRR